MDQHARHLLAIVGDLTGGPTPGMSILDFGCGAGRQVQALRTAGFDAFGCDVSRYENDAQCLAMHDERLLRVIDLAPYRLPFDDCSFDLLLSNQVMEHVQDYASAVSEMHRVLKPGGAALHVFPSRWKPIEVHVSVPFAGAIRHPWWLGLWARLGVRNGFQVGMDAPTVTRRNHDYLLSSTHYLSADEIARAFGDRFPQCRFVEDVFLKHSTSPRSQSLYQAQRRWPLLRALYSSFHSRAVFVVKAAH